MTLHAPTRPVFVVVTVLALLAAACSGAASGSSGASKATGTSAASAAAPAAGPERYTGDLDGFYRVPDPLPPGEPGDLVRVQQVRADADRVTVRVMYHSTDETGRDRAVTGIVTYPTAAPPAGGWPVLSTAHGTTGIASPCAPSRTGTPAPGWGVPGVWAETDYIGLGPVGERHAYLSRTDEANSVIDIVRAARRLPDAHAGRRWISIGHSQGGHGALSAHELAAERAPELHLVATVALAPAAMLDRVYGGIDPIVTAILTMMGLYGAQDEHPDVDLADYLTPAALQAATVFDTGCLQQITDVLVPVVIAGAFTADPRTTEPARTTLLADDVGHHAVPDVPLFLASGTQDDRVVIDRFLDTATRICASGQHTEIHVVDGATHDSVVPAVADRVTAFIDDALAGRATPDSCATPPDQW